MTDDERAQAYDEIEKWTREMQRPMLLLRTALGARRAGIELPEGRKVEDELAAVLAVVEKMPIGLLAARAARALSVAEIGEQLGVERRTAVAEFKHPAMAVACPLCGATVGHWCKRPSGHSGPMVAFHAARRKAAEGRS